MKAIILLLFYGFRPQASKREDKPYNTERKMKPLDKCVLASLILTISIYVFFSMRSITLVNKTSQVCVYRDHCAGFTAFGKQWDSQVRWREVIFIFVAQ